MIEVIYKRLRENYSCTLNSKKNSIEIYIGSGYFLILTHKVQKNMNIFKIASNRGSKSVIIPCSIDENGHSDIMPLYCFIDDFSSLL